MSNQLPQAVSLTCTVGGSNKQYDIELHKLPSGNYWLVAHGGPIGGTLTKYDKGEFTDATAAEKAFAKLEASKRKKGYVGPGETP
jgi:predicted DNA-binding WGR domain protein